MIFSPFDPETLAMLGCVVASRTRPAPGVTMYGFLADLGFGAPFYADPKCAGSVCDAGGRHVPYLTLPGLVGDGGRRKGAEALARALNEQAEAAAS